MRSRSRIARAAIPPEAWVVALAAFALVLHVHFVLIDARPAVDLGHVWSGAIRSVRDGAPADTPYAALVAALWRLAGRTPLVLEALDGLWTVLLVCGLGLAGHRAGGATGAIVAASAGVLFPLFPTAARTHWIHHPEAGAAALALGLAAGAPRLRNGLALGLVAGVAATVRPSAAFWLLIPLLLWTWRAPLGRPAASVAGSSVASAPDVASEPTKRGEHPAALILMTWAPFLLGVAAIAPSLPGYLALRLSVREATAAAVGAPLAILPIQTGPLPGLLALALAARGLWLATRPPPALGNAAPSGVPTGERAARGDAGVPAGEPPARPGSEVSRAVVAAAAAWFGLGLVVLVISGAGPDNVPVLFVGLAVLAAAGAADLPRLPVVVAVVLLLLLGPGAQLWPRLGVAGAVTGWRTADEPLNWLVPNPLGFSEADLRLGIDTSCPPGPAGCRLVVERGLVHPSWEDDGALALFLAGLDHVDPVAAPVWDGRGADAAVAVACRGPVPDPSRRFPGADEQFRATLDRMRPVHERIGNGCARRWYAPIR